MGYAVRGERLVDEGVTLQRETDHIQNARTYLPWTLGVHVRHSRLSTRHIRCLNGVRLQHPAMSKLVRTQEGLAERYGALCMHQSPSDHQPQLLQRDSAQAGKVLPRRPFVSESHQSDPP